MSRNITFATPGRGLFASTSTHATIVAPVPRVRLHDLRHSYAMLMLESGVDLKTVSHALGHSTIRITADTSARVTPAIQQLTAERPVQQCSEHL